MSSSSSIENRVVSLSFDNAAFKSKATESLSVIDKLKSSLDFGASGKSLSDLQSIASKFTMDGLHTAADGVSAKFVAMAAIAVTALSNITNKAIDAGINIAKALTINPLKDGLEEYETNMNSIQTILANTKSKGSTLDDVNRSLDQLNEYSDKTIYNFGEMARNIGTFTAAGVDLDTSVKSIKGIANVAAMSGSSSAQATTAMYQLSQAIAAGTVKLMDWNSVTNAGMGGEQFKSALFETGKALGTIKDVPMTQTFTEWEAAGNKFRETLSDEWLTSDVLTTTLAGISGDMSAAELSAKGFSDAQVVAIQEMSATATAAATEVKTASQMMGTLKEAIGTGWATSFRYIIGDFVEAKTLFTGLNNFFSGMINAQAEARNNLLAGWKWVGGRKVLMEGLIYSIGAVKTALDPVKQAFREVFPPMTLLTLYGLTEKFRDFAQSLVMSAETSAKVKTIFTGVFSVFKIGVEIFKGVISVLKNIGGILFGFSDGVLSAGAGLGGLVVKLKNFLVEGGGIQTFFEKINGVVSKFGEVVAAARGKLGELFSGDNRSAALEKLGSVVDAVREKFSFLGEIWDKLGAGLDWITEKISGLSVVGEKSADAAGAVGGTFTSMRNTIKSVLGSIWDTVSSFFGSLGDKIGGLFTENSMSNVGKVLKTGILAGILAALTSLIRNGMKLDFGMSDLIRSASGAFEELGGTLKAFQLKVKADALLRIAAAMVLLTGSLVVLATVDPKALATSMGAMAVGFGQLVAAMAVLTRMESNPAKLAGLATSMILLSGAAAVLSVAVKMFSTMSWEEMARGLLGMLGVLQLMTMAAGFFAKSNKSFLKSAISLGVLSISLLFMAIPLKLFSMMSWEEMGRGLLAVAATLGMFAAAVNLIPSEKIGRVSLSLAAFGFGLSMIHRAVTKFANMTNEDMVRGFAGLGLSMGAVIATIKLLPKKEELQAAAVGILLVSAAMLVIAKAIQMVGGMSTEDAAKGVLALGSAMAIMVLSMNAMQEAAVGAPAILMIAGAMLVLGKTLEVIGNLSIAQLITGLVGMAAVLVILGAAAAALVAFPLLIPALQAMGIVLGMIGLGFTLLGAGAYLTAKALVELGNAGESSISSLRKVLETIIGTIPGMAKAFAEGVVSFLEVITKNAPKIIEGFTGILTMMLDQIIKIMPKIVEVFGAIIDALSVLVVEKSPELIAAGLTLLINFMTGIRDNIGLITQLAMEIMTNFINSVTENIGTLAAAASNMMVAFLAAMAAHLQNVAEAGVQILAKLIEGIGQNIATLIGAVTNLMTTIMTAIGSMFWQIILTGVTIVVKLIAGISNGLSLIATAAGDLITRLINDLTGQALRVVESGKNAVLRFLDGVADNTISFVDSAGKLITNFLKGLRQAIDKHSDEIAAEGRRLAGAILNGVTGGLAGKAGGVFSAVGDLASGMVGVFKKEHETNSPSKVFYRLGRAIPQGLVKALNEDVSAVAASKALASDVTTAFNNTLGNLAYGLEGTQDFSPKITPVLDLTSITKDAKSIGGIFAGTQLQTQVAYSSASQIAKTTDAARASETQSTPYSGPTEVRFEQNNYSPKALSAGDVYRNTRNQIAFAKEELSIP